MKDDDAWMFARDFKHPRVVTVIIAHVIDNRVVITEGLQSQRVAPVIVIRELSAYLRVRWFEAIDEQRDVCLSGEVRQELFAVVGNSGRLWIQRAEVSQSHNQS